MVAGTPWIECGIVGVPMIICQYADDYEALRSILPLGSRELTDGKIRAFWLNSFCLIAIELKTFPLTFNPK